MMQDPTSAAAKPHPTGAPAAGNGTFLTFRLNNETFGVEITKVREIVEHDESITRVPRTPDFMRGVMNLRGNVVPVVDLNLKLGFPPTTPTEDTCIIIVEVDTEGETLVLGAVADAVEEVLEIQANDILAPPPAGTGLRPEFLTGLARRGDGFVMLMRVDAVLAVSEIARVGALADRAAAPSAS